MNYLYVGKIHSPHGIKGALKILSDYELTENVFEVGTDIYIGPNHIKKEIIRHRIFKEFHLVELKEIDTIEEVISLIGMDVFIDKGNLLSKLKAKEFIMDDLIGLHVKGQNKDLGVVIDIVDSGNKNLLLKIKGEKEFFYPFKLIQDVNLKEHILEVLLVEGLYES